MIITKRVVCFICVAFVSLLVAGCNDNTDYGALSKNAFYQIEADPFNRLSVSSAASDIERAYAHEPNNPWVLVAASRLTQEAGYQRGDRYKSSSYQSEMIEQASHYAKDALKYGRNMAVTHTQYAKIQMIEDDLKGAWKTLSNAYNIDPQNFYAWYYRAVIAIEMNDVVKGSQYLDESEKFAFIDYQKDFVKGRRIALAKIKDDRDAVEQAYKDNIASNPDSAHGYGNYAHYLKNGGRYEEAVFYYKKAIEVTPYKIAKEGLDETLKLMNNDK